MYNQQGMFRRLSKSEVYQAIQTACVQSTGVYVSNIVRIEETPMSLRHSCYDTGVTFIPQNLWRVPTEYGCVDVPYYFCPYCGKLFVYNNIYD